MVASQGHITELVHGRVDEQLVARARNLLSVVVVLILVSVGTVRAQTVGADSHHDAFVPSVPLLSYASTSEMAKPPTAVFPVHAGIQATAQFANSDSMSPHGDRSTHVKVGALTGATIGGVAGALVGIIADQQATNAHTHFSGAGIVLGAVGALVGGIVGASLPHS